MRYVLDVSHLMGWNGRLSGIERVEYNILLYYAQTDACYVAWNHRISTFEMVSQSQVEQLLSRSKHNQQYDTLEDIEKKHLLQPIKNIIKRKASPVHKYNPDKNDVFIVLAGLWDKSAYIAELVKNSKVVQVHHIVYDMIPIIRPAYVLEFVNEAFTNYMRCVLPVCSRVYAISENSAHDTRKLLKAWGKHNPPVESFRLGDDIIEQPKDTIKTQRKTEDQIFFLATGTIEIRKNYELILYMYKLAQERGFHCLRQ